MRRDIERKKFEFRWLVTIVDQDVKNNDTLINKSGVSIFREKSVFFSSQSPRLNIRFFSRNRQDTLCLRRFFKEGGQTPDWCINVILKKWMLLHNLMKNKDFF